MSLSGAINSAVSALRAQSQALAVTSDNIANAETYGYKTSASFFESLVTSSGSTVTGSYSAGGVQAATRSNVTSSGLLESTSNSTDLAIDGQGFFVVSAGDGTDTLYYTRNGAFTVNTDGELTNNGYTLLGWPTDADGTVTGGTNTENLTPIDIDSIASSASATTEASVVANLPANAETGDTFTSTMDLYDSLGTPAQSTITWTKTGENTWTLSFADPTASGDSATTVGTVSSSAITVTFNGDGTLASTSPSPATLTVAGWTSGATDSSITLDLGTVGSANGLSQYTSSASTLTVSPTISQDGKAYGTLSSIAVADDGTVNATYSNGQTRSIFKIPVATFTNANGLEALSGAVYRVTDQSGASTLHLAGADGAGTVQGSTLEASTTDTNEQFSNMIAAQQAYSAASKVMSTANDMFQTLLQVVS